MPERRLEAFLVDIGHDPKLIDALGIEAGHTEINLALGFVELRAVARLSARSFVMVICFASEICARAGDRSDRRKSEQPVGVLPINWHFNRLTQRKKLGPWVPFASAHKAHGAAR